MPQVSFSPIALAARDGLEEAQLVLVDETVVAILVHVDAEDPNGASWYLHSGFGPWEAEGHIFPDFAAVEAWVGERLQKLPTWTGAAQREAKPAVPPRPLRVLIVEDNSLHALYLESYIRDLGCEVVGMVANASKAVEAAATRCPDLVFMDVHLADGTDGVMAARTIHERFGIPSIFITGLTDPATRVRIEQVKPLELLAKPLNVAAITAALQRAAELRERNRLA